MAPSLQSVFPELTQTNLLYVSCLPKAVTKKQLYSYFRTFGEITYLELNVPKAQSYTNAFLLINFLRPAAIETILKQQREHKIKNRLMKVKKISKKEDVFLYIIKMRRTRIYLKKIPKEFTEETLYSIFEKYGAIENAYYIDSEQNKGKRRRRVGYVVFKEVKTVEFLPKAGVPYRGKVLKWVSYFTRQGQGGAKRFSNSNPECFEVQNLLFLGGKSLRFLNKKIDRSGSLRRINPLKTRRRLHSADYLKFRKIAKKRENEKMKQIEWSGGDFGSKRVFVRILKKREGAEKGFKYWFREENFGERSVSLVGREASRSLSQKKLSNVIKFHNVRPCRRGYFRSKTRVLRLNSDNDSNFRFKSNRVYIDARRESAQQTRARNARRAREESLLTSDGIVGGVDRGEKVEGFEKAEPSTMIVYDDYDDYEDSEDFGDYFGVERKGAGYQDEGEYDGYPDRGGFLEEESYEDYEGFGEYEEEDGYQERDGDPYYPDYGYEDGGEGYDGYGEGYYGEYYDPEPRPRHPKYRAENRLSHQEERQERPHRPFNPQYRQHLIRKQPQNRKNGQYPQNAKIENHSGHKAIIRVRRKIRGQPSHSTNMDRINGYLYSKRGLNWRKLRGNIDCSGRVRREKPRPPDYFEPPREYPYRYESPHRRDSGFEHLQEDYEDDFFDEGYFVDFEEQKEVRYRYLDRRAMDASIGIGSQPYWSSLSYKPRMRGARRRRRTGRYSSGETGFRRKLNPSYLY